MFHQNFFKIGEILQKTWEVRETKYEPGSSGEVILVKLKRFSIYDLPDLVPVSQNDLPDPPSDLLAPLSDFPELPSDHPKAPSDLP